jgi:hypothetical protein
VSGATLVVLNLRDQRRDKVKSLVDVGELVQQFDHSVVVFQGVHPYPGKTVLTRDQVFIKRLMLVPEDNDTQNRHGRRNPDYNETFSSLACEPLSLSVSVLRFMQLLDTNRDSMC